MGGVFGEVVGCWIVQLCLEDGQCVVDVVVVDVEGVVGFGKVDQCYQNMVQVKWQQQLFVGVEDYWFKIFGVVDYFFEGVDFYGEDWLYQWDCQFDQFQYYGGDDWYEVGVVEEGQGVWQVNVMEVFMQQLDDNFGDYCFEDFGID